LFMVLVAMGVAWWSDHRALTKRLNEAKERIQFLETSRVFDPISLPYVKLQTR
jgi:hypothetical protein